MSDFTNPSHHAEDGADRYVAAVLALLGDQDPSAVLHATIARVPALVAGLSDDQLRQPEAPGRWSMVEIVQHLADGDLVWAYRMRMALAEDRPVLAGYDQDAWVDRLRYRQARIDDAMAQLTFLRGANLRLLDGLDAHELARVVRHGERGEESVAHMMRLYAGHDLVHLGQLARVRERVS